MPDRVLVVEIDGDRVMQAVDEEGRAYGRGEAPDDLAPGWYDEAVLEMTPEERSQVTPDEQR